MKRKILPILVLIPLFLVSCSLFSSLTKDQPLTDAEMATRVAELLSTMTTPTSEIVFPPTATQGLPTTAPTATTAVLVEASVTPTTQLGGELPTNTPVVLLPTVGDTPTPEVTLEASPTATLNVPASDPVSKLGNSTGSEEFTGTGKWLWDMTLDDYVKMEISDGFLKMTNVNDDAGGWRMAGLAQQIDDYIELTANSGTCAGKDSYGIIFRVPVLTKPDQGYIYQVTCDGYYRLWKWDGKAGANGVATSLINWKQSSDIKTGANQTNRLGVMVVDTKITLYMNGVQLGSVTDTTYSAGFFGVFVRTGGDTDYTVKLDTMKYWSNPVQ